MARSDRDSTASAAVTMVAATVMLASGTLALTAFVDGPFPGHTGGFGEPTCHHCHFDNPLNEPAGSLALTGVPSSYTPGARYAFTVVLTRSELSRGGFQMAARFEGGPAAGKAAGLLKPSDARAQIVIDDPKQLSYLQHTAAGTLPEKPGTLRWAFDWVAPDTRSDPVVFHLAGNAANDDLSPLGDYIYTLETRALPPKPLGGNNRSRLGVP